MSISMAVTVVNGQAFVSSFTTGKKEAVSPSFTKLVKRHKWSFVTICMNRALFLLDTMNDVAGSDKAFEDAAKAETLLISWGIPQTKVA